MSGHPRRDHDSSRDRHRERDRDRSWDRGKDRESDRYRRTDGRRQRSRERETDTDHGRQRSHRPKSFSRSPRRRDREHSREHLSKEEHAKERCMRTFARGGRIFEDNGGLPSLQQQGIEDRWAGFSEPSATRQHDAPLEHQQHYAHHGMSNQYQADAYSAYGANLEAGLEGDISAPAQPAATRSYSYKYGDGEEEYDFRAAAWSDEDKSDWAEQTGRSGHRRRRGWRDEPSATLYVRGVPDEAEEADFHALLSGFAGVRHVRVTKDRSTGRSKGYAFVDFDTIEAATAMMESEAGEHLELMGQRLQFEYSVSPQPAHADGSTEQSLLDWICSMCQAVNFSRRLECYQCSTVRAADVKRVTAGPEGPSSVLKVSGIEPHTTEDVLHSLIAQHVPVREIRLVRDKYTGEPRGFCFVQFHSVADAGRALQLLQNAPVEGQASTVRLCYAKERAPASGPAADALQAAAAMSAYTDWAPKQFDESAPEPASAAAPADAGHTGEEQPDISVAASQQSSGFVYDPASGYYHDPISGYYYDANTGLYFVSESQQWLGLDPNTGQFYDPAQQPAGHVADPAQVPAVPSLAEGQTHALQQQSLGDLHAPEATYEIKKAPAKKKGAVIGSAPKLNSEGLLAAARAAQEKEERQKAQESKQKAKAAAAAAAAANRQQQSQAQLQARPQPQMPHESQGLPGVPTPQGPVRGVIRSSGRWNKQA